MPYPTQTWIILPKIEGYQNKREEAVLGDSGMWTSTDCISLQSVSHFLNQQTCSIFPQTSNPFHPYLGYSWKPIIWFLPLQWLRQECRFECSEHSKVQMHTKNHVSECDINPFLLTCTSHLFTKTFSDRKLKTLLSPLASLTIMKMLTFKSAFYYIWFHFSCKITGWDANQCAVCCQMACWKGTNSFHTECYVAWECCSYTSK